MASTYSSLPSRAFCESRPKEAIRRNFPSPLAVAVSRFSSTTAQLRLYTERVTTSRGSTMICSDPLGPLELQFTTEAPRTQRKAKGKRQKAKVQGPRRNIFPFAFSFFTSVASLPAPKGQSTIAGGIAPGTRRRCRLTLKGSHKSIGPCMRPFQGRT